MKEILSGSIDLSKIDKSKIKSVTKKDGTIGKYLDITIFVNDEQDKYGNIASIAINGGKDEPKDQRVYLGNAKRTWASNKPKDTPANEQFNNTVDDLPF